MDDVGRGHQDVDHFVGAGNRGFAFDVGEEPSSLGESPIAVGIGDHDGASGCSCARE
jgi:hypothetical protein